MMNKIPKTTLKLFIAGFILASAATTGCNDSSTEKKDVKTDTTVTKMDTTPKMDTASTRPIVPAN